MYLYVLCTGEQGCHGMDTQDIQKQASPGKGRSACSKSQKMVLSVLLQEQPSAKDTSRQ